MNLVLAAIVGIYGVVIGSFLNALVWRVYTDRSIAKGRSMCPDCKHELAIIDLVPALSWLLLHGKCRYCHKAISWQYPLVELSGGLLFGWSYLVLRPAGVISWVSFIVWLVVLAGLLFLTIYDLRWQLLPDKVLLPVTAVYGLFLFASGLFGWQNWSLILRHGLAGLAIGLSFYLLASIADGKLMGGGDVKLVFLMGLLLGFRALAVALFIAFNTAAVIGLLLMTIKRKKGREHIPFGPFLALGTIIAYLYGPSIINWYLLANGLKI